MHGFGQRGDSGCPVSDAAPRRPSQRSAHVAAARALQHHRHARGRQLDREPLDVGWRGLARWRAAKQAAVVRRVIGPHRDDPLGAERGELRMSADPAQRREHLGQGRSADVDVSEQQHLPTLQMARRLGERGHDPRPLGGGRTKVIRAELQTFVRPAPRAAATT